MNTLLLPLLSLVASGVEGPRSGPDIEIAIHMEDGELDVGSESAFLVELRLPPELTASKAGAPAPFLQLDVPPSVRLVGRHLTTYEELANNEFVMEPYERLLRDERTPVPFEIVSAPSEDETIGINVVAYVRPQARGGSPFFLRRRFELPLRPTAEAVEVAPTTSRWGPDRELLQLGDRMGELTLPDAGGAEISLGDYLGDGYLIVTTYRAHW
jgi:hypothetical protein